MAYQTTTTTSYGKRLSGSFKGIGGGLLLFLIGTGVLWWNEGRAVKTSKAINEAQGVTMQVDNVSTVDPSLNGQLIHASAFAGTNDSLYDASFGVGATAIKLHRAVEYYQWVEDARKETRDKLGGGQETVTTYTYKEEWCDSPVNSGDFSDPDYKGRNFTRLNLEDKSWTAQHVSFGAYVLPEFIINAISGEIPADVNLTGEQLEQWQKQLLQPDDTLNLQRVHTQGNVAYFGASPNAPAIGDLRVTFTKVLPADISIIAKVHGNTFERYIAKNGQTFSGVSMGNVSAESMFQAKHSSNKMLAWVLRVIGFLFVFIGLKGLFGFLETLFKVVPFLADIVGAGVGLVCMVIGIVWSLIIIALAWLAYRPLIGIALLVVVAAGIFFLKKKAKERKAAATIE